MDSTYTFVAGDRGPWITERVTPVTGEPYVSAPRLDVIEGNLAHCDSLWCLRGFRSNLRYTTTAEHAKLLEKSAGLGRPEATLAALIPIRKNDAWWALAQDQRRALFEETSRHTSIGLEYLPNIARRLYHSRDLGEPFDFLTWFEYAPQHEAAFDELLVRLRRTQEWTYVDREFELRLRRAES
ncbi:MAG: chlorite dismutase [Planctomyces sp.]|nr:chlorite dismutase [Planctomyces sp.]